MVPLFPGLPGGPELLIALLVTLLPLVAVGTGVVLGIRALRGDSEDENTEERVRELEREVADLRKRLDDRDENDR